MANRAPPPNLHLPPLLPKVRNRVARLVERHALGHIPVLDQASPDQAPDPGDDADAAHGADALEMDGAVADAVLVRAGEHTLQLHAAPRQLRALRLDGERGAVAADLGRVVDEVLRGVGVIPEIELMVHVDVRGEGLEDFGLLALRRERFRRVLRAAERVVVLDMRCPACRDRGGKGGHGESGQERSGERGEMHFLASWRMRRMEGVMCDN